MGKNRLFEDDVLVIGLGRFGSAVATELTRLGHRVIAVERDSALAQPRIARKREAGARADEPKSAQSPTADALPPVAPTEPSPATALPGSSAPLAFDPAKLTPEDIQSWFSEVRFSLLAYDKMCIHPHYIFYHNSIQLNATEPTTTT